METERTLATVLFTDIVGSTARAAELGDEGWRALLRQHDASVRYQLARFHGQEVNHVGDGFVAAFHDPERALRCACSIRDSVAEVGLQVRCGLHTGEVQRSATALGGIAVHIAARLVAQAGSGEVVVSHTVRDLVTGSGFEFVDLGTRVLKGVPGEWQAFAISHEPVRLALPSRWERLRERLPRPSARNVAILGLGVLLTFVLSSVLLRRDASERLGPPLAVADAVPLGIAVLPFAVSGSGVADLREGMVDLLTTNLDGLGGLRTIDSRTVLARWRESVRGSRTPDLASTLEVARGTGARYALVGSAIAIGERARLSVEVYELRTGAKIGTANVEGSPDSLFTVVNRLSIQILGAILPRDAPAAGHVDLARVTTDSLRALRAYLDGEAAFRRSDFRAAVSAYGRAVEIDSTFALANARLGAAFGWGEDIRQSKGYLSRAARWASRLPEREAMLVRASLAFYDGSLDALEMLRTAVRRYPDDPEAWFMLGDASFHLGDQGLVGQQEYRQGLTHTVALDTTFTPAYIHLLSDAFYAADSGRAARLMKAYVTLAGSSEDGRRVALVFDLAFGGEGARAGALRELEGLPSDYATIVARDLWNVRFLDLQERVLRTRPRDDRRWGPVMTRLLFYNGLSRGRLRGVIRDLDETPLTDGSADGLLYLAHAWGVPLPPGSLEREPRAAAPEAASDELVFFGGARACDREDWEYQTAALASLRGRAAEHLAQADSVSARRAQGMALALEGYGTWKRGELERALALLEEARRRVTGLYDPGEAPPEIAVVRIWLGRLLLELGRPDDALPYFRSFWLEPIASFYRGTIYAESGHSDSARRELERFLAAWKEADPEMEPLVRRARESLAELARQRTA